MTNPPNPPYIPAKYTGGPQDVLKRIVIHGTTGSTYCGAAYNTAKYFQNPSTYSSAHYVVDNCAEYQCVYDHTVAWHDGTNADSIGVEICDEVEGSLSRWDTDPAKRDALERAAVLVRQLCLAYDIPIRKLSPQQIRNGEYGICGHDDMRDAFPGSTTHWDPGKFPWKEFISLVRDGQSTTESEDNMSFYSEPLEYGKGRHFEARSVKAGSSSGIIDEVFLTLTSGFGDLTDVKLHVVKANETSKRYVKPERGDNNVGTLKADTSVWFKLPSGVTSVGIDYRCASRASRPTIHWEWRTK